MMFLWRMLQRRGGSSLDPLQVSMTGVRMGERFLLIGCHDKALLSGLAAKVGLSGTAAVAVYAAEEAKRAESVGRKVGALIDVTQVDLNREWPFPEAAYDMIVIDDTDNGFRGYADVTAILRNALASTRPGGRIEIITKIAPPHETADFLAHLTEAGFKPVRILAERNGFRFVEGLRTSV